MDISKDKLAIIEWVVNQQNAFNIERVRQFVDTIDASDRDTSKIVGQNTKGDRVTKRQLVERVIASLQDLEKNNFQALDEVENQSEQW
ncbi:MAG: hypothetical protein ACK4WD_07430 [Flavobacteriales bacterium]|jgi:hypothetical protein